MLISEIIGIKSISVNMTLKMLIMMHDTSMPSIENEAIGIIFIFISITMSS